MRPRLFWKILFSFWLTFICIVEGVWIIFSLNDTPHPRPWEVAIQRSTAETRLGSAATALRLGGEEGLQALLAEWPGKERLRLSCEPVSTDGAGPSPAPNRDAAPDGENGGSVYSRIATLPGGVRVLLRYDTADLVPRHRPGPFSLPPELLILAVLGGLLFSSLLAWYLAAPAWRLRSGFAQLAGGNLDVRLKKLMGRRRDEIADLAGDFDLMAERMQSLVESREQLLHDVSHELRSPLARQHMAIGLARKAPERTPALLNRIEQESSRMDELVGELLTLSRVESGGSPLDEYFDLQELVRVVVGNARFEAEQEGVAINLSMIPATGHDGGTTIRGDAELVRRALENVVRNGVRHTPRNSSVDVSVTVDGGRNACAIRIADHGPGVPGESLGRIFEPFVRLGKGKSHGVGLGLAIAKRAIVVHGGTIAAENREGAGLAIVITLGLEPPEEGGAAEG